MLSIGSYLFLFVCLSVSFSLCTRAKILLVTSVSFLAYLGHGVYTDWLVPDVLVKALFPFLLSRMKRLGLGSSLICLEIRSPLKGCRRMWRTPLSLGVCLTPPGLRCPLPGLWTSVLFSSSIIWNCEMMFTSPSLPLRPNQFSTFHWCWDSFFFLHMLMSLKSGCNFPLVMFENCFSPIFEHCWNWLSLTINDVWLYEIRQLQQAVCWC